MSEWLTTGQMIDIAINGGILESKDGLEARWDFMSGMVVNYRGGGWEDWKFTNQDKTREWRLIPAHVSFEKAMIAYREGKRIVSYPLEQSALHVASFCIDDRGDNFATDKERITKGKWAIEN